MKAYLLPIVNDLFDVAKRIAEIDVNYVVYFNKLCSRFEVHNLAQRGDTLAVVVPYDKLDARTITLVRKTRVENAQRLFDEMEKTNNQLQSDALSRAMDRYAKEVNL
ncbi:MAG: hypothetical protein IKC47_04370 [Clostridia bacterium]|nr:hypothetical protein [Clostridia bacterium]